MSPELHGYVYAVLTCSNFIVAAYFRSWLFVAAGFLCFLVDANMLVRTWPH